MNLSELRREYNHERPHEALGLKPPLSAYAVAAPLPTAARAVRGRLARPAPRRRQGYIRWERTRVFISTALAHEDVFVDPELDAHGQRWEIRWGDVLLGWID